LGSVRALRELRKPILRRELSEPLIVDDVGIRSNLALHDLDHDRGKNASDCVDRIVPRKAFAEKALKRRGDGCLVCKKYLVLHDHVGGCVNPWAGQLDACAAVMLFDKSDLLALGMARCQFQGRSSLRFLWENGVSTPTNLSEEDPQ
jgi:hypothetical protein